MTRDFACFICGKLHHTYEEFREHIIHSHEEGRHYILCPLERCQAPVRDLRQHFKAKHPYDKVPKAHAMRATEWHDPYTSKKVKKVPVFKEGFFTSQKNGGAKMHYRSGFEIAVYQALEKMDAVESYEVEPVGIEYHMNGFKRYWPDLKVKFKDGKTEVWEIKPANQTDWKINELKWGAAKTYCSHRGWEFRVITENEIKQLKTDAENKN